MKEKIFILGDSISIHYGPYLKSMLGSSFLYDRKGAKKENDISFDSYEINGGDSRNIVEFLLHEKEEGNLTYENIIINCGLHDIKTDSITSKINVPIEEYEQNLITAFKMLKEAQVSILWINSTPVEDTRHNSLNKEFFRYNQDLITYNNRAEVIASSFNIPIIDLYAFTTGLNLEKYYDHIHFVEEVRMLQASFIAGHIFMSKQLKKFQKLKW